MKSESVGFVEAWRKSKAFCVAKENIVLSKANYGYLEEKFIEIYWKIYLVTNPIISLKAALPMRPETDISLPYLSV